MPIPVYEKQVRPTVAQPAMENPRAPSAIPGALAQVGQAGAQAAVATYDRKQRQFTAWGTEFVTQNLQDVLSPYRDFLQREKNNASGPELDRVAQAVQERYEEAVAEMDPELRQVVDRLASPVIERHREAARQHSLSQEKRAAVDGADGMVAREAEMAAIDPHDDQAASDSLLRARSAVTAASVGVLGDDTDTASQKADAAERRVVKARVDALLRGGTMADIAKAKEILSTQRGETTVGAWMGSQGDAFSQRIRTAEVQATAKTSLAEAAQAVTDDNGYVDGKALGVWISRIEDPEVRAATESLAEAVMGPKMDAQEDALEELTQRTLGQVAATGVAAPETMQLLYRYHPDGWRRVQDRLRQRQKDWQSRKSKSRSERKAEQESFWLRVQNDPRLWPAVEKMSLDEIQASTALLGKGAEAIYRMHERLNDPAYDTYGEGERDAVRRWFEDNGLKPDKGDAGYFQAVEDGLRRAFRVQAIKDSDRPTGAKLDDMIRVEYQRARRPIQVQDGDDPYDLDTMEYGEYRGSNRNLKAPWTPSEKEDPRDPASWAPTPGEDYVDWSTVSPEDKDEAIRQLGGDAVLRSQPASEVELFKKAQEIRDYRLFVEQYGEPDPRWVEQMEIGAGRRLPRSVIMDEWAKWRNAGRN